jgi:hypothetical protein
MNSAFTLTTGAGLSGGGVVNLGGTANLSIEAGAITGSMLAPGAIDAAKVDTTTVQSRVAGTCAGENFVQSIGADGTVTCGAVSGASLPASSITNVMIAGGSVSNDKLANAAITLNAGAGLSGGGAVNLGSSTSLSIGAGAVENSMLANPSVTINAGSGLTGGGSVALGGSTTLSIAPGSVTSTMLAPGAVTAGAIDTATVQSRITGACAVGSYITTISGDGTVTCATPAALDPLLTGGEFTLTGGPGTSR